MKKLISVLLTLALCLSLAACGSSAPDKQPAVDAFNNASAAYDALVDKINPNIDSYDAEFIDIMKEMGSALTDHKNILESDQELTEEEIQNLIGVFGEVETWAKNTDSSLKLLLAPTGDKQSVIDLFNRVSGDFNAMTAEINANIDSYDQQVIDVMTQMANALNEYGNLLNSGSELTAEEADELTASLTEIEKWVTEASGVFVGGTEQPIGDKQAAIDVFNATSEMFNAIAVEVNSHIEDFPQELIDGMTQMAEGLNIYKEALESGADFTQEQLDEMMEACGIVQQWAEEAEEYVFG